MSITCSWRKTGRLFSFHDVCGMLLWTVPLFHWENQFWLHIILTCDTISSKMTYPKIQIYLNDININSQSFFQMSKLWKSENTKPSVETSEYQKTLRSKYESFPKIFFSLPPPPSFLPSPSLLSLLSYPFILLSSLSLLLLFFPLYFSSLSRELVKGVSIICISSTSFPGDCSPHYVWKPLS